MKRRYAPPVFEYESYELDEFVANCANTLPNHSKAACGFNYGDMGNLFNVGVGSVCDIDSSEIDGSGIGGDTIEDDRDPNGFCYHIPVNDMQYFGS